MRGKGRIFGIKLPGEVLAGDRVKGGIMAIDMKALIRNLREYSRLKAEYKKATMVYQYDEKLECAKELGLTFPDDVDIEYSQWAQLRGAWHTWRGC